MEPPPAGTCGPSGCQPHPSPPGTPAQMAESAATHAAGRPAAAAATAAGGACSPPKTHSGSSSGHHTCGQPKGELRDHVLAGEAAATSAATSADSAGAAAAATSSDMSSADVSSPSAAAAAGISTAAAAVPAAAGGPAPATAAAVGPAAVCGRAASTLLMPGKLHTLPDTCPPASGRCGPVKLPFLPGRLAGLAEAAAEASRQQGSPVVAMVLAGSPPTVDHPPAQAAALWCDVGSSSSGTSAGGLDALPLEPPSSGATGDAPPPITAAAEPPLPGLLGTPQQTTAAAEAPLAGLLGPEGGPALLQNPDGSEVLVLLTSGQAEPGPGRRGGIGAGAGSTREQQGEDASLPSYQAPPTAEDERIRQAIARADMALQRRRHTAAAGAPPTAAVRSSGGTSGSSSDWLQRMREADAALRAAVASNDQQHLGGGSGETGTAGGGGEAGR